MGFSRLDTLPFFHANGFHREVSVKQVERLRKNSPHYVSWFDLVDDSYNPGQNDVTTVSNEVGSLATLTQDSSRAYIEYDFHLSSQSSSGLHCDYHCILAAVIFIFDICE